jgi:pimeloyl-ACP methyl ester carboxylesterase
MPDTSHTAAVSVDERRVGTPHGSIFVQEVPGEDPAVVLMHGFPDDQRIYARLLPLLSPRRAVTFDFLGYGRSERSDTAGFTPEDHAAQITAVLDELDISNAVLVGHDASGPDTVFYALAHPERVAALALLNTVFGRRDALIMPEMTKLLSEPELATLADDMIGDPAQRLWLLQRWGQQWELDSTDPEGLAAQSILPQFYGNDTQPDALARGPRNFGRLSTGRTPSSPTKPCTGSPAPCRSSSVRKTATSVPHSPRRSPACSPNPPFTWSKTPGTTPNTTGPKPSLPSSRKPP